MAQKNTLGVIIGRFQVPSLHAGHRFLVDAVLDRHEQVLILVGVHNAQPTERNPLPYELRKQLIREVYPNAIVEPLYDCATNAAWSRHVDNVIEQYAAEAILYGSRDSFAPHYEGKYAVEVLPELPDVSGSQQRQEISPDKAEAESFRKGVIYSVQGTRFPIAYPTVDVAVLHTTRPEVLLGRKPGEVSWRFIGGFVDPTDQSFERAARREVREEAGDIEIDDLTYICSANIDDSRYYGCKDGIMTSFFAAKYIFGHIAAGDDLEEVRWFPLDSFIENLNPNHRQLGEQLRNYLA